MKRILIHVARFAIAMVGYFVAVIAAVVAAVLLLLLVTFLPQNGEWGPFSRSAQDLITVIGYGLMLTFPSAYPGFIVALVFAQIFRWRGWLTFSIAGAVNGLVSIPVLGFYANESPIGMPSVFLIPCILGGFAGGLTYWVIVGRFLAASREVETA